MRREEVSESVSTASLMAAWSLMRLVAMKVLPTVFGTMALHESSNSHYWHYPQS